MTDQVLINLPKESIEYTCVAAEQIDLNKREQLAILGNMAYSGDYSGEKFVRLLLDKPNSRIYIATHNDQVVGVLGVVNMQTTDYTCDFVTEWAVHPELQNTSIGGKLFAMFKESTTSNLVASVAVNPTVLRYVWGLGIEDYHIYPPSELGLLVGQEVVKALESIPIEVLYLANQIFTEFTHGYGGNIDQSWILRGIEKQPFDNPDIWNTLNIGQTLSLNNGDGIFILAVRK